MNPIQVRPEWQPAPEVINLVETDVHLWVITLEQPEAVVKHLVTFLADEERERMARYVFPHLRQEYAVARGAMRSILAWYLGLEAKALQFAYGAQGKPRLAAGDVKFNLSHSGGLALLGVTRNREIGVDIELVRPVNELSQMAKRNFSAAENVILSQLPAEKQTEGFFNCWTRKEAYIKALGDGFSYPLYRFDVTLKPGEAARLLRVADDPAEASRWHLEAVKPAEDYIAAVIVEGRDWTLRQWQWDGKRIVA
ncbi:MAG: 4'-phosphopantetheinyl transferase superfamily protein [Anaerolineae bacterium]|nr:4'-phosphopantetheinyl transferase superfamily protein [Anaerolineae bacterium]